MNFASRTVEPARHPPSRQVPLGSPRLALHEGPRSPPEAAPRNASRKDSLKASRKTSRKTAQKVSQTASRTPSLKVSRAVPGRLPGRLPEGFREGFPEGFSESSPECVPERVLPDFERAMPPSNFIVECARGSGRSFGPARNRSNASFAQTPRGSTLKPRGARGSTALPILYTGPQQASSKSRLLAQAIYLPEPHRSLRCRRRPSPTPKTLVLE